MGPYSIWDDDLPFRWPASGPPMPAAGRFFPGQPGSEDWPKVPGYSCAHCGCLVARTRWRTIHLWNKSAFCRPWKLDFHLARPYQEE